MERMGRFRRSLRDSFRKKRDAPESSKPHQWQADEEAVRGGNCSFHVKYLGCVEVFESRGMPVCEEAMKVLRQSRRRPVKALLHISGDGLRVVEDDTKGLIVDQTIEKVSFCAPDRNHEKGFSYICRDGTTRRWMCHGFLASKDSGERLSHAVGCAFASCLERKQKREKECGVSMSFDPKTSTFTRSGSFRVNSLTDSLSNKSTSPPLNYDNVGAIVRSSSVSAASNPHAIERPHAPVKMLERQGSFRGFSQLSNQSPFKRQLSLRLSDLPSNLQRTQPKTTDNVIISPGSSNTSENSSTNGSPCPPPRTMQRSRLQSLPNTNSFTGLSKDPGPTATVAKADSQNLMRLDSKDLVSELCQQVSQGLSLLAANHDEVKKAAGSAAPQFPVKFSNPWEDDSSLPKLPPSGMTSSPFNTPLPQLSSALEKTNNINRANFNTNDSWIQNIPGHFTVKSAEKNKIILNQTSSPASSSPVKLPLTGSKIKENVSMDKPNNISSSSDMSASSGISSRPPLQSAASIQQGPSYGLKHIQNTRVHGSALGYTGRSQSVGHDSYNKDPFNADWAKDLARTGQTPNNPFSQQQTFQISM